MAGKVKWVLNLSFKGFGFGIWHNRLTSDEAVLTICLGWLTIYRWTLP